MTLLLESTLQTHTTFMDESSVETHLSRFERNAPSFPATFFLKNLASITAPIFAFKRSPHQEAAEAAAREWFKRYKFISYWR